MQYICVGLQKKNWLFYTFFYGLCRIRKSKCDEKEKNMILVSKVWIQHIIFYGVCNIFFSVLFIFYYFDPCFGLFQYLQKCWIPNNHQIIILGHTIHWIEMVLFSSETKIANFERCIFRIYTIFIYISLMSFPLGNDLCAFKMWNYKTVEQFLFLFHLIFAPVSMYLKTMCNAAVRKYMYSFVKWQVSSTFFSE